METSAFFGENGLTSTSANHICNLAKEYIDYESSKISNLSLYKTQVSLIGSQEKNLLSDGLTSLDFIPQIIDNISNATALIAWLREAIKEKESLAKEIRSMDIIKYCEETNQVMQPAPEREDALTETEYYESLPIKERNRYYQLEAEAATLGKYIHPNGSISIARKKFYDKKKEPNEVVGSGRDTLFYSYTPTVGEQEVESMFFSLQAKYRTIQASLNSMKAECKKAVEEDSLRKELAFKEKQEEYQRVFKTLLSDMNIYKTNKAREIRNLKIAIPNALRNIYEEISKLG